MDRLEIQEHLLRKLSLRIGDEMAGYVHRRMTAAFAGPIPVIAHDARTGLARAVTLTRADLLVPGGESQRATGNSSS